MIDFKNTAGKMERDSWLELYFSGLGKIKFEFKDECNVVEIGQAISAYVLK